MKTSIPCSLSAASERAPTPDGTPARPLRRRTRPGVSLVELLAVAIILSFLVGATAQFYNTSKAQHQLSRDYSQVQTDLRTALRRVTRTLRHGFAPKHPSTRANFPSGSTSNSTQVIVPIPEADGAGVNKEIRIYYSNGSLYAQRSDETGAGTLLINDLNTSPAGAEFRYYKTVAGANPTEVANAPETATEIRITLTGKYGRATTSVVAYVALRNVISGTF